MWLLRNYTQQTDLMTETSIQDEESVTDKYDKPSGSTFTNNIFVCSVAYHGAAVQTQLKMFHFNLHI